MADDENSIKVIFEADTSSVDAALKKTSAIAQKSAQKISSQDKGTVRTSNDLIKNANKAIGLDTKLVKSGIKSAVLENKQFTAQKNQFKLQVGQHTRVGKLLTFQNKEQQKSLNINNKLLKIDTNRYKTMKQLGAAWKSNKDAYAQMQSKRAADAAAMQATVGSRPPTARPPQDDEEGDEKKKKEPIDWSKIIRPLAAIVRQVGQFVAQPMMEGYQKYVQFGRSLGRTIGQGSDRNINYGRAQELAFSQQETIDQAYGAARSTGHLGAVRTAQETSRFYGGSVEEASGYMGALTRGGAGFNSTGGGQGRTQLFRMLRDAISSGLDRSRVGEHLDAVAGAIEATGTSMAGDVSASNISGLLALIGSTGRSGFQGARGMNVLSQIDQGFKSGGRDDFSDARQLAAYGFGVPGQDTDYYTARRRRDQGIFGGQGMEGAQNLSAMLTHFLETNVGNRQAAIIDAQDSGLFGGLGIEQLEGLFDTFQRTGGDMNSMVAAIDDLRETQGSVEEQIRDNLKTGQANIAQRVVDLDNRLLEIGRQVFPSITRIQDAVIDVQNVLLPTAIAILERIAQATEAIVSFFNPHDRPISDTIRTTTPEERRNQALPLAEQEAARFRKLMQETEAAEQAQWAIVRANPSMFGGAITPRAGEDARRQAEALAQQGQALQERYDEHIAPWVERERARAGQQATPTPTPQAPTVNVAPAQANVTVNVPASEPANARIPVSGGNTGIRQ